MLQLSMCVCLCTPLQAEFRSIPGMVVIRTESPRQGDESVPWYAIAVPIAVGVILLIVAVVVLYFVSWIKYCNVNEWLFPLCHSVFPLA